jgi:transcription elongation factor Elf1
MAEYKEPLFHRRQRNSKIVEPKPKLICITPGTCPRCGSTNLDYGSSDADCDIRVYPFTCSDCGTEAEEIWTETFLRTEEK